ncbi:MAG: hypothetical protein EZS28_034974, partial [Streblomastix strix]
MTTHISQNDRNYIYDDEAKAAVQSIETWGTSEPKHFNQVRISSIALLKMIIHAYSGGIKEITGQLLGK